MHGRKLQPPPKEINRNEGMDLSKVPGKCSHNDGIPLGYYQPLRRMSRRISSMILAWEENRIEVSCTEIYLPRSVDGRPVYFHRLFIHPINLYLF